MHLTSLKCHTFQCFKIILRRPDSSALLTAQNQESDFSCECFFTEFTVMSGFIVSVNIA